MGFYVQNVNMNSLVPDGEYKARIAGLKLNEKGDTVIIRCEILTEGFEKTMVTGFCGAHWNPSTRTTANLRQWCINLGMNVVKGQEAELDLDELKGRECRIIVQSYKSKTGEDRCKVSNILPLERKAAVNPQIKTGFHVAQQAAPVQQPVQVSQPVQAPVQQPAPQENTGSESDEDSLW